MRSGYGIRRGGRRSKDKARFEADGLL